MAELTKEELEFHQVIEYIGGKVRVHTIVEAHVGDENDPLTTYVISGYKDVHAYDF